MAFPRGFPKGCPPQYVVGVLRPYCESKGDGTIKKEESKGVSYFYVPNEVEGD